MALTTLPTAAFASGSVGTAQLADSSVTSNKVSADLNFRNYVINGDLSVWQRGTSFTNAASGSFTADRWCMSYRAIGNADIAQVNNISYKSLKVTNSNGSAQEIAMRYRVENISQFNNNSFILSFYAKASASVTLDTRVYENYGSGGSATVTVVAAGSQNKTITTSRQRFTISFTTSDMSSKTIGTSNYLEFSFHPTLASGQNWEFDSVQLEKGTVASDFENVPYEVNYRRCLRYYEKIDYPSGGGDMIMGAAQSSQYLECYQPLLEIKRAQPTVQVPNPSDFRINDWRGHDEQCNGVLVSTPYTRSVIILFSKSTHNLTQGYGGYMNRQQGEPYITVDAEL